MDRRGLLRGVLGAGLAAVTTKLWLPPVPTALAEPERTVHLPPVGGWPEFDVEADIAALRRWMIGDARRITGVDWVDVLGPYESAFTYPQQREEWDLTIRWSPKPGQLVEWPIPDAEVHGPGYDGFMNQYLEDSYADNMLEVTERWTGRGPVPQAVIDGLVAGKDGRIEMTRRLVPVWPNRYIVG